MHKWIREQFKIIYNNPVKTRQTFLITKIKIEKKKKKFCLLWIRAFEFPTPKMTTPAGAQTATTPTKVVRSTSKFPNFNIKFEHLVAGISGGVTSTLILHPLDLIKIRFAGKSKTYIFSVFNIFYLWK